MKTSLKDIAEELRLSKTTVSWVLSGRGNERGISQATQDRVKQCARRMNYQPNLLARSLNTGVSSTIGLILPSISDSFYSQVAREVEMEAERHGYSLMICSSESEGERENRMIRMFRAKQVDGIILAPTKISKTEIRQLVDDAFPLVVFDRYFSELKTHYIIIDNEQSSYRLVSHLIERGARRIAIVTTNPHLTTMDQRRAGYARALTEAGLPVDPDLYGEAAFVGYEENVFRALDRIFAMALEAFRYFHGRRIDINDGYGLACIHEVPAMSVLAPAMNVARMPVGEIGRNAVRMLLGDIRNRGGLSRSADREFESLVLPCELCFRD